MAQQINLRTPILLAQKRYFSANTVAVSLAVFVVLGGVLCGYWVHSLNSSAEALGQVLKNYAIEKAALQTAIQARQADAAPLQAALKKELDGKRDELGQRGAMLEELQRGLLSPGQGHSARMRLVAQSIPAQVWVTDMLADASRLEVRGFTLEPAALNGWLASLTNQPLLRGQALAAVKVERASVEQLASSAIAVAKAVVSPNDVDRVSKTNGEHAGGAPSRPVWSFTLVSALPPMQAVAASGAKP